MQTTDCEKCRLLFNDALQDELSPELQGYFVAHLNECKECASQYEDFKQLSYIIADTPPVPVPNDIGFNFSVVTSQGKKTQKQKTAMQWLSIAAVFLVFVGSYALYDNKNIDNQDEMSLYIKEDSAAFYDDSYGIAECPSRSEARGNDCAAFDEALSDPAFLTEIENADLGFGYELLQCNQEEDGTTTFVIYFYEDESYTIKTPEQSYDVLSLPNVRSFHWKKNELLL